MEVCGPMSDELSQKLKMIAENPSPQAFDELEQKGAYDSFLDRPEAFMDMARDGEHGATARYWMLYIDLVEVWLLFSQAICTCDVNLFVYSLSLMVPLFLVCNKHTM